MTERCAVRQGCIFNALLFPVCFTGAVYAEKFSGAGGALLLGCATAQLFSLSYFFSLLVLKWLPPSMLSLPVFGGFFGRMLVLAGMFLVGQSFFPATIPFFAAGFGITTCITLIAETVLLLRVDMERKQV